MSRPIVDRVAERIYAREGYVETRGPWEDLDAETARTFLARARFAVADVMAEMPRREPAPLVRALILSCVKELRRRGAAGPDGNEARVVADTLEVIANGGGSRG